MLAGACHLKSFYYFEKISFILRGYSEPVLAGIYSNALVPANLMELVCVNFNLLKFWNKNVESQDLTFLRCG